jgi:hypothetical protein
MRPDPGAAIGFGRRFRQAARARLEGVFRKRRSARLRSISFLSRSLVSILEDFDDRLRGGPLTSADFRIDNFQGNLTVKGRRSNDPTRRRNGPVVGQGTILCVYKELLGRASLA